MRIGRGPNTEGLNREGANLVKDAKLKRLYAEHKKHSRSEVEVLIADFGEFLPMQLTVGLTACFGWL
jgi:hypothetical protein